MPLIEYTVGSEQHSSYWGKFYVRGLEKLEVKESGERDGHKSYTIFAAEVPLRTIFTVFSQAGNKRGTQEFDFYVCEATDSDPLKIVGGCYGSGGQVFGSFTILVHGEGKVKAPRLMDWWGKISEKCFAHLTGDGKLKKGTRKRYALWCAQHLNARGLKELPAMPVEEATVEQK